MGKEEPREQHDGGSDSQAETSCSEHLYRVFLFNTYTQLETDLVGRGGTLE